MTWIWDGHRLRARRQEKLLSQSDLAKACGCSKDFIYKIEKNIQAPNISILLEMLNVLNVSSLDKFFNEIDD